MPHDATPDQYGFDEDQYLHTNPDVAEAVNEGAFASGWEHYCQFGQEEGREMPLLKTIGKLKKVLPMSRDRKILASIDKSAPGLEIGPSHRPIAPKREGFNVKVLDHLSAEGLKAKYRDHDVDIDAIEEVDYIWSGEPISQLVGTQKFDWIIASHVIEHTPDLIGFLKECETILTENGILSLAVPDKRYCFDHFRELSSLGGVIDAHLLGRTIHSPGTAVDYFLNVVKKGERIAWQEGQKGEYTPIHTTNDALSGMQQAKGGAYIDLHAWCFVPSSFRLMIDDLYQLGFIQLREAQFFDTTGHEFFITLGKKASGSGLSRMSLLKTKEQEMMR